MSIDHDVRVGLAAELDALAPGAGLAAALEALSPAALTGEDLGAYVRGRWRLANRASAELLEGIHHLGRAQAGRTERLAACDEYSGDEVSALLGWSRTMASRRLDLADGACERLPEVGEALHQGGSTSPRPAPSATGPATSPTTTPTRCAGSCSPKPQSCRSGR